MNRDDLRCFRPQAGSEVIQVARSRAALRMSTVWVATVAAVTAVVALLATVGLQPALHVRPVCLVLLAFSSAGLGIVAVWAGIWRHRLAATGRERLERDCS